MAAPKTRAPKSAEAFRSIGEAATELGLETHVLRYWEAKFPREVRPIKREDGRRLFRPQDIDGLRAIRFLVHEKGLTLKGAKQILSEQGVEAVLTGVASLTQAESPARHLQETVARAFGAQLPSSDSELQRQRLEGVLVELTSIKTRIDAALAQRVA